MTLLPDMMTWQVWALSIWTDGIWECNLSICHGNSADSNRLAVFDVQGRGFQAKNNMLLTRSHRHFWTLLSEDCAAPTQVWQRYLIFSLIRLCMIHAYDFTTFEDFISCNRVWGFLCYSLNYISFILVIFQTLFIRSCILFSFLFLTYV